MAFNKRIEKKITEIAYAYKGKAQTGRRFHMTFVLDKSKLVVFGINDYNRHHPARRYGEYKPYKCDKVDYVPGLHSEIAAIIKLGEHDCSKYTFVNVRVGNNGKLNNSKPCPNCQRVFEQLGYRKIYYTNRDGKFEELING